MLALGWSHFKIRPINAGLAQRSSGSRRMTRATAASAKKQPHAPRGESCRRTSTNAFPQLHQLHRDLHLPLPSESLAPQRLGNLPKAAVNIRTYISVPSRLRDTSFEDGRRLSRESHQPCPNPSEDGSFHYSEHRKLRGRSSRRRR